MFPKSYFDGLTELTSLFVVHHHHPQQTLSSLRNEDFCTSVTRTVARNSTTTRIIHESAGAHTYTSMHQVPLVYAVSSHIGQMLCFSQLSRPQCHHEHSQPEPLRHAGPRDPVCSSLQ